MPERPTPRRFRSLANTLIRSIAWAGAVCTLVVAAVQFGLTYQKHRQDFDAEVQSIARINVPLLSVYLWDIEPEAIRRQLALIAGRPQVSYVRVDAAGGRRFESGTPPSREDAQLVTLDIPYPAGSAGRLGTLRVAPNVTHLYRELAADVLRYLAGFALLIGLVCVVVAVILRRQLQQPMQEIAQFAASLTPARLTHPLTLRRPSRSSRDEIDEVVDGFHVLQEEIRRHVEKLDDLVAQRTAELARSVAELRALGEVTQTLNSTLDLETVLTTIVAKVVQLSGTDAGAIYVCDEAGAEFRLRATHGMSPELVAAIEETSLLDAGSTIVRAATQRTPIQIADLQEDRRSPAREVVWRAGYRALLVVPLLGPDGIVGALVVRRRTPGEFPPSTVELLRTFADHSVVAIENARLFQQIRIKSQELDAASQHKSEFLATMSHELRTPLNVIIGFSDVILDRMFGDVNEKQEEYLADILAAGRHLLSLINDILDLSKIEAGRMELDLIDFNLPRAIDNALTLVRERAQRRRLAVTQDVDPRLGNVRVDERKIKQVMLNLLTNAIKFTPEGGRVEVRAAARDDWAEISVIDNGIGIAPEDQAAVFEAFKQVGQVSKKAEGTGLGLALCRKFVELHGGEIWVKSEVGQGSTFTFTIPMRMANEPSNA